MPLEIESLFKLSHQVAGEWVEHHHLPEYDVGDRVLAGVPGGDANVFKKLVECLEPPYLLLYVLHTPRGEADPGRYQSPAMSSDEFTEFVSRYSAFLKADARFDLWAHSPAERATVVWDRHNQLFAYGPTERFVRQLNAMGFRPGKVNIPAHAHHYRHEYDEMARQLMSALEWKHSPLRPEDEQ
jgi:hypothetical protein